METSLSSCGHVCTDLGILIDGEVEEKEEQKNLLKWCKFSFYVMVDREIFTYLKKKKKKKKKKNLIKKKKKKRS